MPDPVRYEWPTTVVFYGIFLLLALLVVLVFVPFLVPLGWAAVLAVLCIPWTQPLRNRWGATRAAVAGTIGVTLMLIVPALLLMSLFVLEGIQVVRNLQGPVAAGSFDWINRDWNWLMEKLGEPNSDLPTLARENVSKVGGYLATQMGAIVANVAVILFEVFVTLFALFYFLRDGEEIMKGLRRVLPFDEASCDEIIGGASALIHASVRVSLGIALLQGLLGGLGFAVAGIHAPVFWGIAMAFLAFLPVVGTWPIWVPGVIWLYGTGHPWRGTSLLIFCALFVIITDIYVRPVLLSGSMRVNGLLLLVGVLGGMVAFGMLGIVLGPVVVATTMSVINVYTRRVRLS